MFNLEEHSKLSVLSQGALDRIRNTRELSELEETRKHTVKTNFSKSILEEFDNDMFNKKIKFDTAYYNVLLNRLEEDQSSNIQILLGDLLKTTRQIYEHINIKPKIYAINRLVTLNESDEVIYETASRVISDYVNINYYKLTNDEKHARYFESVKLQAKELIINENVTTNDAVEYSMKIAVVQSLLETINFPMVIKNEIEKSLISEEYGDMFEQEELNTIWNDFKNKSLNIAKIISAIV
jgi:hypothetical protein